MEAEALLARVDAERRRLSAAVDSDGDGYDDNVDGCPHRNEDFDAFEDQDGCPDEDNDSDGVLDASSMENGLWVNLDHNGDFDCRDYPEDLDEFEDEDGCPDFDNDYDGIHDDADSCKNLPEDFDHFEDNDGCPEPDNDLDGLADISDQCPDAPEDVDGDDDADGCPDLRFARLEACAIRLAGKIQFNTDESLNLTQESYLVLRDIATIMEHNPEMQILIQGHTDSKGNDSENKRLSQKRVDFIKDELANLGIDHSRLGSTGCGEEQPVDTNTTATGRANNRRVEFLRTDLPECKEKLDRERCRK